MGGKTRPRKKIKASLTSKGFEFNSYTRHDYLVFMDGDKKTRWRFMLSRGSSYKDYGISLLSESVNDVGLSTIKELLELIDCDMTESMYRKKIGQKA